jgi:Lar family restriction alleviation protein
VTNNEELKPCPFCGGKPYIIQEEDCFGNKLDEYEIGCNNRKCKMTVYTNEVGSKKRAIAAWNKRVTTE